MDKLWVNWLNIYYFIHIFLNFSIKHNDHTQRTYVDEMSWYLINSNVAFLIWTLPSFEFELISFHVREIGSWVIALLSFHSISFLGYWCCLCSLRGSMGEFSRPGWTNGEFGMISADGLVLSPWEKTSRGLPWSSTIAPWVSSQK